MLLPSVWLTEWCIGVEVGEVLIVGNVCDWWPDVDNDNGLKWSDFDEAELDDGEDEVEQTPFDPLVIVAAAALLSRALLSTVLCSTSPFVRFDEHDIQ